MPAISKKKRDKISEQILYYLFTISPETAFTNKIADAIARDEEFTKSILQELKLKNLILEVKMNPKGTQYQRRQRWRLTDETFLAYSNHQKQQSI